MKHQWRYPVLLPILTLVMVSCASEPKSPPAVDPTREQISILQKQLLELQNNQNETSRKVTEQAATITTLSSRIKTMEDEQRTARVQPAPAAVPQQVGPKQPASLQADRTKKSTAAKKQKPQKKKKKKTVRRQEQ
ncbi:MAG: hypothetical protein M0042_07920 [Nitrospiraceae bacterium]|nr:hypothetical protein [Nitrospiraceae bacterium]